ncbi:MAG: SH3 domain-containing protein [bacterium]|nr:SH3 domain-containing protein [bacterium]
MKKLSVKLISTIISLLVFEKMLYADNFNIQLIEVKEEVSSINNLELTKKEITNCDGHYFIYYDSMKRIRKVNRKIQYPGFVDMRIYYYTEEGNLSLLIFDNSNEVSDFYGNAYFNSKMIFKIYSYYQDTELGGIYYDIPPKEIFYTVDSVNRELKRGRDSNSIIEDPEKQYLGNYSFIAPRIDDITIINMNSVMIRETTSPNSRVLKKLNTGTEIKILEIGLEETNEIWGTHNWYKIMQKFSWREDPEVVGWVFGSFLEPVEFKN